MNYDSVLRYFLQFMVLPVGVMFMALVFSFITITFGPGWLETTQEWLD